MMSRIKLHNYIKAKSKSKLMICDTILELEYTQDLRI